MKRKYPSISVCMIVRDEEGNLPRLLESIEGLADEVIVVDTGSKDATVRIAKDFGAKVHHFPWCDDFSAARNESLKYATKDFILWLDGDDELRRSEHHRIRVHLRNHPGAGAYFRTYIDGEGQALQLRIFPNHRGIHFEGRIHEQAIHSLEAQGIPTFICNVSVLHHGYEEAEAVTEKVTRNKKILEEEVAEDPGNLDALLFLSRTYLALGEPEQSIVFLDRVISSCPEEPDPRSHTAFKLALLDKGMILDSLGRKDEALEVLEYAKSRVPQFVLIPCTKGKIHYERKEYAKAFEELLPHKDASFEEETTPINIGQMKRWLSRALGVSALFVGDFAVAEECFLKAIETVPSDKANYHHLALTRERKGDIDGAMAACRLGIEQDPKDGYIRKRLFLLLLKKQEFAEALGCYGTLNGESTDLDALAGRFLLSCRTLDASGIQLYYRYIQEKLSLEPVDFPQNLQATKDILKVLDDARPLELFDSAVSYLLQQA
jgi:tetratricopeptide (TPR) repeat protein